MNSANRAWYEEINDYNYDKPGYSLNNKQIFHFTQLVWKATKKVGFGVSSVRRNDGLVCAYIVANYEPKGNFLGQFAEMVPKVKPNAA